MCGGWSFGNSLFRMLAGCSNDMYGELEINFFSVETSVRISQINTKYCFLSCELTHEKFSG